MAAGRKTGGRQKGTPNKKTAALLERVSAEGLTPLDVMLQVMREYVEAGDREMALDAAAKAAPYVHPKLSSIAAEVSGPGGGAQVVRVERVIVDPNQDA